jgi:hypothetical protein
MVGSTFSKKILCDVEASSILPIEKVRCFTNRGSRYCAMDLVGGQDDDRGDAVVDGTFEVEAEVGRTDGCDAPALADDVPVFNVGKTSSSVMKIG